MRLDVYLQRHKDITRTKGLELIKNGDVLVNEQVIIKPSYLVKETDEVVIINSFKYVSRAGLKLEDAITSFNLDFKDKVVIDVGSSTGGFTDCSLKYGAKLVYSYDVGTDQMDESLRNDHRIKLFENTNILSVSNLMGDIILIDVSFTSVLPIIKHLKNSAEMFVILYKPQFEVGKTNLKKGIVKDNKVVEKRLKEAINEITDFGIKIVNYKKANIKGKKGNQEYILIGVKNA